VNLPGIQFKFQLIDFFIPFMLGWLIWKKWRLFNLVYVRNLLIFIGVIIISILFNFRHNSVNDLFEVYDIVKYIVVFLVFKEIYQPKTKQLAIDIAFVILIVLNLMHYHNFFGFNEHIMPLYCGENSIHLLTFGYNSIGEPATKRMLGLIGNPNNNAILFMIFLIHYLPKKEWKTKEMFFFYAAVIAVSACQSRTGIIAFAAIFVINFIIVKWKWWKITIHIFIVTLMLVFFFNLQAFSEYLHLDFLTTKKQNKDYIISLFNDEAFQGNSWQKRLEIWQDLLKESTHKPVLGHGPQKNHFYDSQLYSENEYVLMVWRFGLVGLFLYLMIYLIPLKNAIKLARSDLDSKNVVLLILLFMIASITNVPLSNTMLSPLFFMMMGFYYSKYQDNTDLIWLKNLKNKWFKKTRNEL
jgi:O-antigen ligase